MEIAIASSEVLASPALDHWWESHVEMAQILEEAGAIAASWNLKTINSS